jgi:hypothetical protein
MATELRIQVREYDETLVTFERDVTSSNKLSCGTVFVFDFISLFS